MGKRRSEIAGKSFESLYEINIEDNFANMFKDLIIGTLTKREFEVVFMTH